MPKRKQNMVSGNGTTKEGQVGKHFEQHEELTPTLYSHISPPDNLDWKNPNWGKWLRRWERYRLASGLNRKSELHQVNILIYSLGEEADELIDRFNLSSEQQQNYELVIEKFSEYFNGKVNLVFERSKFFARIQGPNEPIQEFINDLHLLAKTSKLEPLKEELIMHKIIQGMGNASLSEKLQMKDKLTLKEVEMRVKQAEEIQKQQEGIRKQDGMNGDAVDRVRRWNNRRRDNEMCQRCGGDHLNKVCPASKYRCHLFRKVGHFAKMCNFKNNSVAKVSTSYENINEKEYLLQSICTATTNQFTFDVILNIGGHPVKFRIDTGADVTIISRTLYESVFAKSFPIIKSVENLYGPGKSKNQLVGKFFADISHNDGEKSNQPIYVMEGEQSPLLGRPAITALGLIKWVGQLRYDTIPTKCPSLFEGIGKMNVGKYKIEIDKDTKPFAIRTPRRIPLKLRAQTKIELEKMESAGMISKIEKPTDWVAGMEWCRNRVAKLGFVLTTII